MSNAAGPDPWWRWLGRLTRRVLIAAAITATALMVGAHSSGSSTPAVPAAPEPLVGLAVTIFTQPPTPPAVKARAAAALTIGRGQHVVLDVLNNHGGRDFVAVPDSNLVELVSATCADLSNGNSMGQTLHDTELAAVVYQSKWELTDADMGFVIGAAVAVVCPEFRSLMEHWTSADTNAGVAP